MNLPKSEEQINWQFQLDDAGSRVNVETGVENEIMLANNCRFLALKFPSNPICKEEGPPDCFRSKNLKIGLGVQFETTRKQTIGLIDSET